jgi:hypothetical protein
VDKRAGFTHVFVISVVFCKEHFMSGTRSTKEMDITLDELHHIYNCLVDHAEAHPISAAWSMGIAERIMDVWVHWGYRIPDDHHGSFALRLKRL